MELAVVRVKFPLLQVTVPIWIRVPYDCYLALKIKHAGPSHTSSLAVSLPVLPSDIDAGAKKGEEQFCAYVRILS